VLALVAEMLLAINGAFALGFGFSGCSRGVDLFLARVEGEGGLGDAASDVLPR